jgi:hypothetical protein
MKARGALHSVLVITAIAAASLANASTHDGTVAQLEVWPNGNVAFTLNGTTVPCNGQAIVNASQAGVKNLYAALLSAKIAGKPVRLWTSVCGPADGYNPSVLYATVDYLYVLD